MTAETNVQIDVIVVGAGAAGMVAAASAAYRGRRVLLLEKNSKAGVKILMSGGTRCNLTQDTDAKGIVRAFGHANRFLQPSVGAFAPSDTVEMFNRLGVPTKRESTGKIFPKSDRAVDVRDALLADLRNAGAELRLRSAVRGISPHSDGRTRWLVDTDDGRLHCNTLIITSGGRSWPGCGTTGDAYQWLQDLGHTIVRPCPALVPLVGNLAWMNSLSGLVVPQVTATIRETRDGKRIKKPCISRTADWLFTHFGYSGPAAMDVSRYLTVMQGAKMQCESQCDSVRRTLEVDLLPNIGSDVLESRLRDQSGAGNRQVRSLLCDWLPRRLVDALVSQTNADVLVAELPSSPRRRLVEMMKRLPVPVSGSRGFEKAEVTAGGVKLSEVNRQTMESRLHRRLFIAGEVLDVDGWIGGYNFQAAFATGRAAALAACEAD